MKLSRITDRDSVLKAIKECDELGINDFLNKYGFQKARKYELEYRGKLYPSKAIIGVAWKYHFGKTLTPNEFDGGLKTVVPALRNLGFKINSNTRNPDWVREEIILALNLYFGLGGKRISSKTPEIIQLSEILIALPIHSSDSRLPSFRNPNGVANKLSNFLSIDPGYEGKGYGHSSALDEKIWDEFSNNKDELHNNAARILSFFKNGEGWLTEETGIEGEECGYPEGRIIQRVHYARERNQALVKKKKEVTLKTDGALKCEVCNFDFSLVYSHIQDPYIECHHKTPLADLKPNTRTTLKDLALVCANCHRMLHNTRPWISVEELREKILITFEKR